ncbi:hypothetical protein R1flu_000986 [Riccia fluitans]|uniref:Uncharacterized protein n=1 Tax=Riccia fluitans TaxID=41844 RepID=A0ABD1Y202_9MARC
MKMSQAEGPRMNVSQIREIQQKRWLPAGQPLPYVLPNVQAQGSAPLVYAGMRPSVPVLYRPPPAMRPRKRRRLWRVWRISFFRRGCFCSAGCGC